MTQPFSFTEDVEEPGIAETMDFESVNSGGLCVKPYDLCCSAIPKALPMLCKLTFSYK